MPSPPIMRSLSYIQFFICIAFVALLTTQSRAELVDRVVAVVNNEVITLSELDEEGRGIFQHIAEITPADRLEYELTVARSEILDTLIDKRLIAQRAKEKNIVVTDAEVDAAFDQVLSRNRLTRGDLLGKLSESGVTEEVYRTTLESQILQNKLVGADVSSKIVITEEAVIDYFDTNYTSRVDEGSYYLLQMGFTSAASGDSREKALSRAKRVHKLALSGKNFQDLAQEFSDLPSAVDGGDIGTFLPDEMAGYMKDAVVGLNTGQVSTVVETPEGYQFFKLLSVGEGSIVMKSTYESVKEEIKKRLYQEEMQKAYGEWVKELKQKAYIQKL